MGVGLFVVVRTSFVPLLSSLLLAVVVVVLVLS